MKRSRGARGERPGLLTGRGDRDLALRTAQAGANNCTVKLFSNVVLRGKLD